MTLSISLWFGACESCLLSFLTYISSISLRSACLSTWLMIPSVFLEYTLEGILPDFFLYGSMF